jgi:hypothetical protein
VGKIIAEEGLKRVAEGFASLVKGGFDYGQKAGFAAWELRSGVAHGADYSAFDARRRVKYGFVDCEEVLHVVPGLEDYAQYASRSASGRSRKAHGYFPLKHSAAAWNPVAELDEAKENLGGNVIRIVADNAKLTVE